MFRSLFQFSIRDLFRLTLVLALVFGWRLNWVQLKTSNAQYKAALQTLQGMAQATGWKVQIDEDTGELLGAAHAGLSASGN